MDGSLQFSSSLLLCTAGICCIINKGKKEKIRNEIGVPLRICWTLYNSYQDGLNWQIGQCRVHLKNPVKSMLEFGIERLCHTVSLRYVRGDDRGALTSAPPSLSIHNEYISLDVNVTLNVNALVMFRRINTLSVCVECVRPCLHRCVLIIAGNEWVTVCSQIYPVPLTGRGDESGQIFYSSVEASPRHSGMSSIFCLNNLSFLTPYLV